MLKTEPVSPSEPVHPEDAVKTYSDLALTAENQPLSAPDSSFSLRKVAEEHLSLSNSAVLPDGQIVLADPVRMLPEANTTQAKAECYKSIVLSSGGIWRTEANQVNIVGLRGYELNFGPHENKTRDWNDTIAFVWADDNNQIQVREFRCTTDPTLNSLEWTRAPDVNGDGKPDIATLRPGQYNFVVGDFRDRPWAVVPAPESLPVFRDLNADSQLTETEKITSEKAGYKSKSILIHWQTRSFEEPKSAGCVIIAGGENHYMRNVQPILAENKGVMKFTLVDLSKKE